MYNSQQLPTVERQPIDYFLPQQLLLLVEHQGLITPEQLEALIEATARLLGGIRLVSRRVLTFTQREPPKNQPATFSLIFTDLPGVSMDPKELVVFVLQLNEYLFKELTPGFILRLSSPNWLLSCTPDHVGTGGPGAVPVSDSSVAIDGSTSFLAPDAPWSWKLPDHVLSKLPPEQRGRGVDVAILDTAPCVHDLVQAYDRWRGTHPLLQSLLRPGGQLHVQNAAYADLARLAGYQLKDHRYLMADHGLFVAGIIHTIAPRANLHLIEVLNPYGVGDLESIALGLWRLTRRSIKQPLRHQRPLLINCSLVVNIPLKQHPREDFVPQFLEDDETIQQMGFPLEWICNVLASQQIQVVAAAGNDSLSQPHRLPARYPAAFDSVIGVGALEKDHGKGAVAAPYSNLADTPIPNSIATFGGAAKDGLAVADEAVLGVFTSDFPGVPPGTTPPIPNMNGWAWWSGTSFATPVITGTMAALLSDGMTAGAALDAILATDAATGTTDVGEGIFPARQGS